MILHILTVGVKCGAEIYISDGKSLVCRHNILTGPFWAKHAHLFLHLTLYQSWRLWAMVWCCLNLVPFSVTLPSSAYRSSLQGMGTLKIWCAIWVLSPNPNLHELYCHSSSPYHAERLLSNLWFWTVSWGGPVSPLFESLRCWRGATDIASSAYKLVKLYWTFRQTEHYKT